MKGKRKQHFAETYWDESDLGNALDVQGFGASEKNTSKLYEHINEEELVEAMIDAGWSYIYNVIWNIESELE